jgi:hypothetical protein
LPIPVTVAPTDRIQINLRTEPDEQDYSQEIGLDFNDESEMHIRNSSLGMSDLGNIGNGPAVGLK